MRWIFVVGCKRIIIVISCALIHRRVPLDSIPKTARTQKQITPAVPGVWVWNGAEG
jgi:hypothetical protein